MSGTVLVTYASRYGSTGEVAEAIANTLRNTGLDVELQPMNAVQSLDGYRAVVLGAPLYIGSWHKDAHNFLARHEGALAGLPVAIFALGPLGTSEGEMQGSREQLDKELVQYPWLQPVTVEMFVGKYDPARLNLLHRLLTVLPASPLHGMPASDHRDWDAIKAWATSLEDQL
ncbi:MAG: flavodoxin [Chloroflexi bacterium]|nr:flavodoxin [Chloroflexota bacterium]